MPLSYLFAHSLTSIFEANVEFPFDPVHGKAVQVAFDEHCRSRSAFEPALSEQDIPHPHISYTMLLEAPGSNSTNLT